MARASKSKSFPWRWMFGGTVLALVGVLGSMGGQGGGRFVITDPQFTLSRDHRNALTFEGLRYASRAKVLRVFSTDFGRSIFLSPLAARRRELLAIDWVEDASVSRIWPDRLVARIRER